MENRESVAPLSSDRVVTALESIAASAGLMRPPQDQVDWSVHRAAIWHPGQSEGHLRGLESTDAIALDALHGVDLQKQRLLDNTRQFVAGLPSNNILLWGSRGTGKSSLVHAVLNACAADGLRVVEFDKYALVFLPSILERLRNEPYRFVLFCDDLSFESDDPAYKALKSALDGSLLDLAGNVIVYATSNRRHLLPESASDNAQTQVSAGEIHHGEAVEEKISLSDRFGVWISFYAFNQQSYLDVARYWVEAFAAAHEIRLDWDDQVRVEALRWALARGNRSGRTANQFARHWVGLKGLAGGA